MKTVVSFQDLLELEIRPGALLEEYHRRLREDLVQRWTATVDVPCPGCDRRDSTPAFERFGAHYHACQVCGSLFVSPRPDESAIVDLYRHGAAARFWRAEMWPRTQSVRLEKLVQPRVEWVLDSLAEYVPGARVGMDLSPHGGPVVEALCANGAKQMVAAAWLADLDIPVPLDGARVQPQLLRELSTTEPVDYVTAFDLLDRTPDVAAFVDRLALVVRPGGLVFLTASNADGFDLQVLWERTPALCPPDKMNVLSIDGLMRRFAGGHWEILELSTPGVFDLEHVRRVVGQTPDVSWPRFVGRLLARADHEPSATADFQQYLQRYRLASFARVLLRRRW